MISDDRLLVNGEEIGVTASVGIASISEHTTSATDVLHEADMAMYQHKTAGQVS